MTGLRITGVRLLGAALLLAAAAIGLAGEAAAFRLVPMVMDFAPSGRAATQSFGVVNNTEAPIAVEISIVERSVDLEGNETYTPEEEDFIVYPPQMVVMPGKVQVVQVRWVGEADPGVELPYRIIAEQLPIRLDRDEPVTGGRIEILLKYEGAIYVVPDGAVADVVVDSIRPVEQDGERRLEVVLHNQGGAHGVLQTPSLTIAGVGPEPTELRGDALGPLINANILAGAKRRFLLAWPEGLAVDSMTAEITADIVR